MKTSLVSLLVIAGFVAACSTTVADADPSAVPSASASNPAEVMPDELPVVVFSRTDTKGMIAVGDRIAFDLPDAASWTATVDTAGLLELNAGELTGTAAAPGDVVVTLTNGSETIVYKIAIR